MILPALYVFHFFHPTSLSDQPINALRKFKKFLKFPENVYKEVQYN